MRPPQCLPVYRRVSRTMRRSSGWRSTAVLARFLRVTPHGQHARSPLASAVVARFHRRGADTALDSLRKQMAQNLPSEQPPTQPSMMSPRNTLSSTASASAGSIPLRHASRCARSTAHSTSTRRRVACVQGGVLGQLGISSGHRAHEMVGVTAYKTLVSPHPRRRTSHAQARQETGPSTHME